MDDQFKNRFVVLNANIDVNYYWDTTNTPRITLSYLALEYLRVFN